VRGDDSFFNGHVPVTTMVTLLPRWRRSPRRVASRSATNTRRRREPPLVQLGHQPPMEQVLERGEPHRRALAERVGDELVVASYLRDRSELWSLRCSANSSNTITSFEVATAPSPGTENARHSGVASATSVSSQSGAGPFLSRRRYGHFLLRTLSDPRAPSNCAHSSDSAPSTSRSSAWATRRKRGGAHGSESPRGARGDGTGQLAKSCAPRANSLTAEAQGPSRVPAHWLR